MHRVICGGPNPEKRPDCMKGEETDPPARVNGILVGVIPRLGQVIGDVMNRDHPVGEGQDDEDEDGECKIAQKVHGSQLLSVKSKKFLPVPALAESPHGLDHCVLRFTLHQKSQLKALYTQWFRNASTF
jgi:hypothetical protein